MPRHGILSDEEEAAERAGQDRLRAIDQKLRDLYGRRAASLTQVHQLSDEQRALADQRAPLQAAIESVHRRHREIGNQLMANRRARDAARKAVDEALADLREHRAVAGPRVERPRPEALKREIAQLELKQQTTALPIADENALIGRVRELRRQQLALEKEQGAAAAQVERAKALEEALRTRRTELERLGKEGDAMRAERDATMGSVRAQLFEAGSIYAELRTKAQLRSDAMGRVEGLSKEIYLLESEGNRLLRESRNRRFEAQRAVKEYNRGVRDATSDRDLLARTADAQFEELLRRGRISLGGGSGT